MASPGKAAATHSAQAAQETVPRDSADPKKKAKALRVMANPLRMRIMGVLRTYGSQTVGQLADKLDEAPGGISYHLSQLADAGMAERAGQENGDRRKSWWKASASSTVVSPSDIEYIDNETVGLFRKSVEISYESAYMRYLDSVNFLPRHWAEAGTSNDHLIDLTAQELTAMVQELEEVILKWSQLHEGTAKKKKAEPDTAKVAVILQAFRWIP